MNDQKLGNRIKDYRMIILARSTEVVFWGFVIGAFFLPVAFNMVFLLYRRLRVCVFEGCLIKYEIYLRSKSGD